MGGCQAEFSCGESGEFALQNNNITKAESWDSSPGSFGHQPTAASASPREAPRHSDHQPHSGEAYSGQPVGSRTAGGSSPPAALPAGDEGVPPASPWRWKLPKKHTRRRQGAPRLYHTGARPRGQAQGLRPGTTPDVNHPEIYAVLLSTSTLP